MKIFFLQRARALRTSRLFAQDDAKLTIYDDPAVPLVFNLPTP
jgi:hypothetical protein